jgi:hypothetical protein
MREAGPRAGRGRASRSFGTEVSWTLPIAADAILLSALVVQSVLGRSCATEASQPARPLVVDGKEELWTSLTGY